VTVVCQTCIYYNDLYDLRISDTYTELGIRLFQALGFSAIFLSGVYFLFPETIIGSGVFLVSTGFVLMLIAVWRILYAVVLKKGIFNEPVILLGRGELARKILKEIGEKKDSGYTIVATAFEKGKAANPLIVNTDSSVRNDQTYDDLCNMARDMRIRKIVVAIQQRRGAFPTQELLKCRVAGFNIIEGYSFYEMLTGKLLVEHINPAWLIFSKGFQKSATKKALKRLLDILLSILLLIIFSPLFAVVSLFIKLDSSGSVFFSQERVGENRKQYVMHKFRSMVEDAEKSSGPVWASDHDPRITRVGKIIRKTRIDELPQIWNVLKGDMSFVGPRPERKHFVDVLDAKIPYYGERFTVKPGITGWAQVSYGYGATVEDAVEKLSYDLFYTKNFSLLMDLMILMRTVKIVLFGKGAR
jgi:sugar transferase (PEP-CTERM system associated)